MAVIQERQDEINGLAIATLRGVGCCRDERAQAEGRRRVDDAIPSSSLVPLPLLATREDHGMCT